MTDWIGYLACAAAVILILLPPKYDPAIRLKEWNERKHRGRDL